jgi:hypothetical protein
MPDTLQTAVVAACGLVLGALVTSAAAAYSARQKLREIELTHRQQLRTNYLANARQHSKTLYVPLAISLADLTNTFQQFHGELPSVVGGAPVSQSAFEGECRSFMDDVGRLFQRGASAFLTVELEERLISFCNFVRSSLSATAPTLKRVIRMSYRMGGVSFDLSRSYVGPPNRLLFPIGVDLLGLAVAMQVEELVSAPVSSEEFGERFVKDATTLKTLVKEVTLGGRGV